MTELVTNYDEAVGLFGTCGGSTWREPFYSALTEWEIPLFDPQISPETHGRSWCEADIENEVRHLERNPVLMFKVNGETTGLMSLLEIVKSIQNPTRYMIVLIEDLNIEYRDHQNDPRLKALEQMLLESRMKVPDILKDIHNARQWTRKAVAKAESSSPLVHLVPGDEAALEIIQASYAIFRTKRRNHDIMARI